MGIHLTNIRSNTNINSLNDIYFNQINAPIKAKYGIKLDHTDKISVDGNRIQNPSLPNANYNYQHVGLTIKGLVGINIQSGKYNTISSNTCRKLGVGVRYYISTSDNYTSCNDLDNNWYGGSIDNSDIGDQGSSSLASDNS
jgi:hypothetical protein